MWQYDGKPIYPLRTLAPDAQDGALIRRALLGEHGEAYSASPYFLAMHHMPLPAVAMLLCDIGTEELAHGELLGMMAQMLGGKNGPNAVGLGTAGQTGAVRSDNLRQPESPMSHGVGHPNPATSSGAKGISPGEPGAAQPANLDVWSADAQPAPHAHPFLWPGDPVACLTCAMAQEQCARAMYESLIKSARSAEVIAPLRFLRQREIVHFQRVGEALEALRGTLDKLNPYKG